MPSPRLTMKSSDGALIRPHSKSSNSITSSGIRNRTARATRPGGMPLRHSHNSSRECRNGIPPGRVARAVRFRMPDDVIEFDDLLCGRIRAPSDDFIVKRADGIFAYQLAVVVDDGEQGI